MVRSLLFLVPAAVLMSSVSAHSQTSPSEICQDAAKAAFKRFRGLKSDQFSISLDLIDRGQGTAVSGDYRGDVNYYPCSTVKLFYVAYAAQLLHDGKLTMSPEFDRAAQDMIVDSNNDATALVFDTITGTTGGPELPPDEFKDWIDKRNAVNRFYAARGFVKVNVNQKTWNEGAYGRERQALGPNRENRNSLNTNACAKLMTSIALGQVVEGPNDGKDWTEWMKGYLHRTIPAEDKDANFQSKEFTGKVLPKGSQLWSKAGWLDTYRHDIAWVKLPDGKEFVISVFTKPGKDTPELVPFIASHVISKIEG